MCQKKLVYFAFYKPLISHSFFDEIINFVACRWEERKNFFRNYKMIYPRLNHSMKWESDYISFETIKKRKKCLQEKINCWKKCLKNLKIVYLKIFQVLYIGGKFSGKQRQKLFEMVKDISECICSDYSRRSKFILMNYFLYSCPLRNYSNYHFNFLVIKNKYFHNSNII